MYVCVCFYVCVCDSVSLLLLFSFFYLSSAHAGDCSCIIIIYVNYEVLMSSFYTMNSMCLCESSPDSERI